MPWRGYSNFHNAIGFFIILNPLQKFQFNLILSFIQFAYLFGYFLNSYTVESPLSNHLLSGHLSRSWSCFQ